MGVEKKTIHFTDEDYTRELFGDFDENTITTEVIIEVREEIGVKSKLRKISNLKDKENLEKQEEKTWE